MKAINLGEADGLNAIQWSQVETQLTDGAVTTSRCPTATKRRICEGRNEANVG